MLMPWGWGWRGGGWGWWSPWPGRGPFSYLPPWQRPGWLFGRGACWWLFGPYAWSMWANPWYWYARYWAYPWPWYWYWGLYMTPYAYPWSFYGYPYIAYPWYPRYW